MRPTARFGDLDFEGNIVKSFKEKSQLNSGWINGGFFICEPEIFDYLESDDEMLEREPIERIVKEGQLMAYKHEGFWQCMDTLRDKNVLEDCWNSSKAPWKVW